MTEDIERMAVSGASSVDIKNIATEQGMRSLRLDGMDKVLQGITAIEEILRVVV